MTDCPCGIEFEIGDEQETTFEIGDQDGASFEPGTPVINVGTKDYERLINKPQINSVELVGNKFLQDLFPDGILINCGDSTGYPEPVIPPGVPSAEGVGF